MWALLLLWTAANAGPSSCWCITLWLSKLTILMPHLIFLVQILVFVWVATFVLPLIQPFFSPIFKAINTIANIPSATFYFWVSAIAGFYNSASTAVYGASRNLGMSLENVTASWLPWTRVNSTEAPPISPLREEVVYTFLSKAADSTQNFFNMFHNLCSARGLEQFLQEIILIFDKAHQVGCEAQIPNSQEVVDSILAVHNSFTNVYRVLVHVRWAGLGFLEGYIGYKGD
ncbi:hypothetical protein CPB85DRAFT_1565185 [Mucidula mucida]|nr:hypothetical protein CPB85DRAFT_1565185 [Mucidula mucida]